MCPVRWNCGCDGWRGVSKMCGIAAQGEFVMDDRGKNGAARRLAFHPPAPLMGMGPLMFMDDIRMGAVGRRPWRHDVRAILPRDAAPSRMGGFPVVDLRCQNGTVVLCPSCRQMHGSRRSCAFPPPYVRRSKRRRNFPAPASTSSLYMLRTRRPNASLNARGSFVCRSGMPGRCCPFWIRLPSPTAASGRP